MSAAASLIDWLLQPGVGLSFFLALTYTTAVHFFMKLGYRHFLRHWLVALVGMGIGYGVAVRTGGRLPALGDVHVFEMSVAAITLLVLAGLKTEVRREAPAKG